ncbi:CapA family protein [Nocardioides immobilis]|uniref:CapA family protein n=1 Tax=Nocardioides immobilis TaxID=2049295 RepID=A0A417Y4B5_9ACTN|nr:CapA family protein [Nocardioides immobilis]RHW27427.1 CapA family protein [Nocardioides immobilis]
MARPRRYDVLRLLVASSLILVAGCTAEDDDPVQGGSSPAAGPPSPSGMIATSPDDLAVVGHATRPQLRLTRRAADRLLEGQVRRWRGLRVLVGGEGDDAERAVRAVERDPRTIAVVPLDAVVPTVVTAMVAGVDPVRDHPDAVTVTITGDLMLVRGVPDPVAALAPMRGLLRSADLTVGNLESTLSTNGEPTQGGDSFGGSPALVPILRGAGFDALSLANNHAGDYGTTALVETVATLASSPVVPFGAGPTVREASRPAVLEAGGTRFAFVGFNAIGETPMATSEGPGALSVRMPPRTGPLVRADLARVTRIVSQAGEDADAVVVLPHWGTQYTHTPEPIQREVARELVAAGADLVAGGHPHWVQGVDAVDGVPVLHSLGNFVFDMRSPVQTLEGVVLETTWWDGELKAFRLVPYAMDPADFAPREVAGERAADVLGDVWSASTGPFRAS